MPQSAGDGLDHAARSSSVCVGGCVCGLASGGSGTRVPHECARARLSPVRVRLYEYVVGGGWIYICCSVFPPLGSGLFQLPTSNFPGPRVPCTVCCVLCAETGRDAPRPPTHACVAPPTSTQTGPKPAKSLILSPSSPKKPIFSHACGVEIPFLPTHFFPTPAAWQSPIPTYPLLICLGEGPGYTYLPPVDGTNHTLPSVLSESWSSRRKVGKRISI